MSDATTSTRTPRVIAVVGVGAIGSTFAHFLARDGHHVTVVARPASERFAQLKRDGGVIDAAGVGPPMVVADHLDALLAYDLVIVATLAHQVDAVLPGLQRSQAKTIQFMFNTVDPERLRIAIGAARCSFGMPFVAATLGPDGRLNARINPGQKTLHGDPRWVELFNQAGLPSTLEPDMALWLLCHAPMCIAMESVCAMGEARGGGATWSESMLVARGVLASYAVIQGMGYRIYPNAKATLNAAPAPVIAALLWSVSRIASFRRLLATGVNECRALADALAAAAAKTQPPLPATAAAILAMKPSQLATTTRV